MDTLPYEIIVMIAKYCDSVSIHMLYATNSMFHPLLHERSVLNHIINVWMVDSDNWPEPTSRAVYNIITKLRMVIHKILQEYEDFVVLGQPRSIVSSMPYADRVGTQVSVFVMNYVDSPRFVLQVIRILIVKYYGSTCFTIAGIARSILNFVRGHNRLSDFAAVYAHLDGIRGSGRRILMSLFGEILELELRRLCGAGTTCEKKSFAYLLCANKHLLPQDIKNKLKAGVHRIILSDDRG